MLRSTDPRCEYAMRSMMHGKRKGEIEGGMRPCTPPDTGTYLQYQGVQRSTVSAKRRVSRIIRNEASIVLYRYIQVPGYQVPLPGTCTGSLVVVVGSLLRVRHLTGWRLLPVQYWYRYLYAGWLAAKKQVRVSRRVSRILVVEKREASDGMRGEVRIPNSEFGTPEPRNF